MNARMAAQAINAVDRLVDQAERLAPGPQLDAIRNSIDHDLLFITFRKIQGDPNQAVFMSKIAPKIPLRAQVYFNQIDRLVKYGRTGMGFSWNPFSSDEPTPEEQQEIGKDLLQAYFVHASQYPGFSYSDVDSFEADLERKVPGYVRDLGNLVLINKASTTVEDAKHRLEDLANKSQGKASIPQIVQAAGGSGDTINWWQALPEVGVNTASDLVKTGGEILSNVGEGVLGTLKLTKYLPWVLLGGGALYLFVKAGGIQAVKAARAKGNEKKS